MPDLTPKLSALSPHNENLAGAVYTDRVFQSELRWIEKVAPSAPVDFAQGRACRLSRGRLALGPVGETPTGQPPGRRRYGQARFFQFAAFISALF